MRPDRLTTTAQQALADAQSDAMSRGNAEVGGLHILAALVADAASPASSMLGKVGLEPRRVLQAVQGELSRLPTVSGAAPVGG